MIAFEMEPAVICCVGTYKIHIFLLFNLHREGLVCACVFDVYKTSQLNQNDYFHTYRNTFLFTILFTKYYSATPYII